MADRVTGVRAREGDGVSGGSGCGALRRVVEDDDGEGVRPDAGSEVTIHARRPEVVAAINVRHQNAPYRPDVVLPDRLRATIDPVEALAGARQVVLSTPAQALRANVAAWPSHIEPDAVVVSSMKGVETYSGLPMSEVVHQVTDPVGSPPGP